MSSQQLLRYDGTSELPVAGCSRTEYTWSADTQHSKGGRKSIAARCVLLLAPEATKLKASQPHHGKLEVNDLGDFRKPHLGA